MSSNRSYHLEEFSRKIVISNEIIRTTGTVNTFDLFRNKPWARTFLMVGITQKGLQNVRSFESEAHGHLGIFPC
jgi:hypothetical protein